MVAVLQGRGSDSLARCRGFNSVANPLRFCFQKHHDRATIAFNFAPKRSHNRFNFVSTRSEIQLESCVVHRGLDSMMEEPRSRLNRAAIAVRSDRDRGVLPRILQAVRLNFR